MQDIDGIARCWESELALAGSRETRVPTIASPIGRTWIWSDLHLGDRGPLEAFDRPFADIPAMNRHLLAKWRQRVQPGDTIICLGDVAHPDAWRDRRLVLDLRACPGERILILGNHDSDLRALEVAPVPRIPHPVARRCEEESAPGTAVSLSTSPAADSRSGPVVMYSRRLARSRNVGPGHPDLNSRRPTVTNETK